VYHTHFWLQCLLAALCYQSSRYGMHHVAVGRPFLRPLPHLCEGRSPNLKSSASLHAFVRTCTNRLIITKRQLLSEATALSTFPKRQLSGVHLLPHPCAYPMQRTTRSHDPKTNNSSSMHDYQTSAPGITSVVSGTIFSGKQIRG
jgi:hypothetical protein